MFLDSQLKPQLDLSERKWMGGFWLSESKRLGKKKKAKTKKSICICFHSHYINLERFWTHLQYLINIYTYQKLYNSTHH